MDSEARIQQEIVVWFNNEYPQYRGLLCYNNNNSTGGLRGKINKFLGTVKGRADMTLYFKKKAYMLELKTAKGKQSKAQEEWQATIENQGFEYHVIRSLKEFKELFKTIQNEKC